MPHTLDHQLNEKLRDAQLAFYLTHAVPNDARLTALGLAQTLKTAEDLYTHWLLDVLVSQAVPPVGWLAPLPACSNISMAFHWVWSPVMNPRACLQRNL
ncbi:hypothetical protein [Pseudomonas helleri]|uniref:Uncharacterized protein n=1 Tax=Pseudomonas helleri TaxID=1608996 RepID=A0A7X1YEF2_9PSED|nr:hypothetical protein [Pseudomonas helleri]MQT98625.1 hypothetical protein [Pseudomonas helleri]MQU35576.1 hypothetical protein [Pseudomonas helleri]